MSSLERAGGRSQLVGGVSATSGRGAPLATVGAFMVAVPRLLGEDPEDDGG